MQGSTVHLSLIDLASGTAQWVSLLGVEVQDLGDAAAAERSLV